jgi:RNA polymerase sigma-70 factor (ECF subfamily)
VRPASGSAVTIGDPREPAEVEGVSPAQEASLVALAQQDRAAFGPLYERYLGPVYRYCYRRLGTREAAEDATSIVFSRALGALPSYQHGSFRGWLFTIAHNVVMDAYRRRPKAPIAVVAEPVDTDPTPEEIAIAHDEQRTVHLLLATLPDDQRRVVELRLAGLRGAEIAAVMERSVAAVKMLQLRAMTRLRADPRVSAGTHGAIDERA